MPGGNGVQYDFFLSRRGSVAAIAREVTDVLTEKGYRVFVQDYDIPLGASFVDAMHEAIKNSRDLIILFTRDYEQAPYTRKEFTSFEAERAQSAEERRIVVLRCEDVLLRGLLADNVYQDLVDVTDPAERRRRIVAAAEHQTQAVPPPPRPFIGVPPRIASFVGRLDELDQLDAILMRDKPAAVTQAVGRAAVRGLGGIGKTSLAVEYAHHYRNLYSGVCWCSAERREGLLSNLADLAVSIGAATVEEADVEKAAKAALRRLAEQRSIWLLVYDNVSSPEEIADLLPSAGARILITSRFSDWGGWAEEVELDILPLEQSVAFLQSRAGHNDLAGAKTLAMTLGRLPLALDHAAAYCRRTQLPFADYAAKASRLVAGVPRGAAYPRSVAATFDLAITAAVAQCPAAEGLMPYLAQCAPERIPMSLIEGAIADEAERLEALAALVEASLVKSDAFEDGSPAVTTHQLVRLVARARSEAKDSARGAAKSLIARLAAVYPGDSYRNSRSWPLCAQLTPHLLAQWEAHSGEGAELTEWPNLLGRAASYFRGRAAYAQATALNRSALAIRERTLGPEHPETATNLNNLAGLLEDVGDFLGARPMFDRALAIREKALGPEHRETATSLSNLACLMQAQGKLSEARPLFERALTIREKALGPEHPETATSLKILASLLWQQGDLAAARPLLERALAMTESALGPEHPDTANSLNSLALVLQSHGELGRARPLFERALAITEKALGPEHPNTGTAFGNLALLLQDQSDFVGAQPLFERALAIHKKACGPEHPGTNRSRSYLARLLLTTGKPGEAVVLAETALAAHDKLLGRDHIWTKDSARVTADAFDALGRNEEAKALRDLHGLAGA